MTESNHNDVIDISEAMRIAADGMIQAAHAQSHTTRSVILTCRHGRIPEQRSK